MMYPSISCTHDNQIFPPVPFVSDINYHSNSKQEEQLSSSLFYFPSPCSHYEDNIIFLHQLQDLLLQPQPLTTADINIAAEAVTHDMVDSKKIDIDGLKADCTKKCDSAAAEQIPKRRTSKKDRHSKINTAHGPRDRRMRLSLVVARKFFDLQDMLGLDKASKTVEWLLTKSKSAIKEVSRGLRQVKHSCSITIGSNSGSSTSECEVVSGIDESLSNKNQLGSIRKGKTSIGVAKEKKIRTSRKSAFHPLAKESREKARARARERTREKKSKLCFEAMNHDLNQIGSWSPFETVEESGTHSQNKNPSFEVLAEVEELSSREQEQEHQGTRGDIVSDSLVITGNWSPSIIFNYHHNTGIPQEHQSSDFQFYGRPWEAYNNINLL